MKKIFATLILAGSLATAQAQDQRTTKVNLGDKAPDLAYATPNGKEIKLSEIYKGRIVLLDFWASWCGPCRMANPKLVSLYKELNGKKFKGAKKGFTVVSVSLDQKKEAWVAAIEKDKLEWPYHMSDLGGWRSAPAATYGIEAIPQAILIDANGKIIGKYMQSEQAENDIRKLVEN